MDKNLYVFTPRALPYLAISGTTQRFAVNRVYCVGRNYAEHAREMGDDPDRDPPFFFCKDASCIVNVPFDAEQTIAYPSQTQQYEYEVEMVVALKSGGDNLTVEEARQAIYGYAIGLDMTRRDLQSQAKQKGRPWETGKSFDRAAPMSPLVLQGQAGELDQGRIALTLDSKLQQQSDLSNMTWSVAEIISRLSQLFTLKTGDLIMTGTPENVGSVVRGQLMTASVEGIGVINLRVV